MFHAHAADVQCVFSIMILINGETLSEEPAQPVSDLVGQ